MANKKGRKKSYKKHLKKLILSAKKSSSGSTPKSKTDKISVGAAYKPQKQTEEKKKPGAQKGHKGPVYEQLGIFKIPKKTLDSGDPQKIAEAAYRNKKGWVEKHYGDKDAFIEQLKLRFDDRELPGLKKETAREAVSHIGLTRANMSFADLLERNMKLNNDKDFQHDLRVAAGWNKKMDFEKFHWDTNVNGYRYGDSEWYVQHIEGADYMKNESSWKVVQ